MSFKLSQLLSKYSIKRKLNFTFFSLFILFVILLSVIIGISFYNNISREVDSKLQALAQSRANHLNTYFEQNIERLKLITSRTAMRRILDEYNSTPDQEKIDSVTKILKDAVAPVGELERVCILSLDGEVISSTDKRFLGKHASQKEFFIDGREDEDVYFVQEDGEYKLYFSGPIELDNKLIGVGLSVVNLDYLKNIIHEREGLSKTGETLIAFHNKEGKRVYPVRRIFEDQALKLSKESDLTAEPMKAALSGVEKVFNNTLDYRDKEVIAASAFVPKGNIGLVAKMDRSEALLSVYKLFIFYIAVIIFFVLFYLILSNYKINTIIRPLEKLRKGVGKVKAGNLDYKFNIKGQDEVALLAQAFDEMSEKIKITRSQVDQKVKKQTVEIEKKAKNLKDQRKAILNILEDVDLEKQNTEKEKEKINAILQSIGDAVFVVNKKMEIVMFNKIAEEISGYKVKEALGEEYDKILRFIYEKNHKVNDEFIKSAMKTGEIKEMANHTMLIRKNGDKVAVADSASPLKDNDGEIKGCVVVFRDVSEERAVDRAKTEFVSLASHQLKTPLGAINWNAEMLLSGDYGKLDKEQKEVTSEIYNMNKRMISLVNNLLNVSRIDMGRMKIAPKSIDLIKICNSVLQELKDPISKKGHKIIKDCPSSLKFLADPNLIRVVFQNLISNAVKYTDDDGRIKIKIKKRKEDLLISVANNGLTISEKEKEKIFQKMFRSDSARKKDTDGSGLGLYMVKQVVDKSGGKIWFDSGKGEDTVFYVSFPLSGMKEEEGEKSLS